MQHEGPPTTGIFISYRRDDTRQAAGRLADELAQRFGRLRVFRDVETIEAGVRFKDALSEALEKCNVMLVLIGSQWLKIADPDGRPRLRKPEDWVRTEIATALKRSIRVIPVLIDDATMPQKSDLPADLQPLLEYQAIRLDDDRWHSIVPSLIESLAKLEGTPTAAAPAARTAEAERPAPAAPAEATRSQGKRIAAVAGVLALLLIAFLALRPSSPSASSADSPDPAAAQQANADPAPAGSSDGFQAAAFAGTWSYGNEKMILRDDGDQVFSYFINQDGNKSQELEAKHDGNRLQVDIPTSPPIHCGLQLSQSGKRLAGACAKDGAAPTNMVWDKQE